MAASMAAVDGATTHHHLRLRTPCVDADDYSRSADRGEVLLLRGEHKTTRWTEEAGRQDADEKHDEVT